MLALIILIIVIACTLAYVPNIPPVGRTILNIVMILLCVFVLLDVLGLLGTVTGGHGRLLCP